MSLPSPPRPNEQRKVENLLMKLSKITPISAKAVPSTDMKRILRTA
jgi:hypothetical protein